jgi:hypothetical protein
MKPFKVLRMRSARPIVTLLGKTTDTNAGAKAVNVTAAVGDLLVCFTAQTGGGFGTLVDNQGGTWTTANNAYKDGGALDLFIIWIRDQICTVAGTYTITHTPQPSTTGSGIAVVGLKNMKKPGFTGVHATAAQSGQASGGIPAPVLTAAPLIDSVIFGLAFIGANATLVPRVGYTELFDEGYNTPFASWQAMYRIGGETSQTITWGGAYTGGVWGAIVTEITP